MKSTTLKALGIELLRMIGVATLAAALAFMQSLATQVLAPDIPATSPEIAGGVGAAIRLALGLSHRG